jgi:hypothetical protein
MRPSIDDVAVAAIKEVMEAHHRYDPSGHNALMGFLRGSADGRVSGVYIPEEAEFSDNIVLTAFEAVNREADYILGVVGHVGEQPILDAGDPVRAERSMLPFYGCHAGYDKKRFQLEIPYYSVTINSQGSWQETYVENRDRAW